MQRHTFALEIEKGYVSDFLEGMGKIWDTFTDMLDRHKITNFSMWRAEYIVFGYYETENSVILDGNDKALLLKWEELYGKSYRWISAPFQKMRLMYHDFGIIRKNKELIRHRVFVTKLLPGCEEEYKLRHDALIEARGGNVTVGPDSNFSIWSAGGYIFGYDEIDTTMEREMTEDAMANITNWETRQLEIMTWVTNDVDWLTGEYHENIKRICFHNGCC